MEKELSKKEKFTRASLKVKELREFYTHLIVYCLSMPLIIGVNYLTSWEFKWFWFSLLGWGFGLLMHALKVFGKPSKWEELKIREYMNDDNF